MKPWLSIFLVVLYTVALVKPVYPLLEYVVRMEEYKQRCINKARPELHCQGKCILMQKLRILQQEEPDPVVPVPPKITLEDYPVCMIEFPAAQAIPFIVRSEYPIYAAIAHPRIIIVDIFRPPQA